MSFAVDVNVLVYASDERSPFCRRASRFLERSIAGRELFCLAWATLMSYVRIVTHPAIFQQPLSPEEAVQNVEGLIALPHTRILAEEEGFWDVYRETTRDVPTRGNLVPDAHLAALLRQHGVSTLYTRDRDFLKFEFLDVRDPFIELPASGG